MDFTRMATGQLPVNGNRTPPGWECRMCALRFSDDTLYWLHVRRTHGQDPGLKCPVPGCGKRFATAVMRTAHLAHHQGYWLDANNRPYSPTVPRPHTCEVCGRLSASGRGLARHMLHAHPKADKYRCGVCTLMMRSVVSLEWHVRNHHRSTLTAGPSRHHRCDVCAKLFRSPVTLIRHSVAHVEDIVFSDPLRRSPRPKMVVELRMYEL